MKKIIIIAIIFLGIGGYIIANAYDYDLNNQSDRENFMSQFMSWLKGVGKNIVQITGLVVDQTWLPDINETNTTGG